MASEKLDVKAALQDRLNAAVAAVEAAKAALRKASAEERKLRAELGRGGL